ncbi:MAG: hypothetical protein K6U14_07235 [Firmicutes bacterium]|nr:hypothetical protein [Alicyclobacillaceae bacterium]MCL6497411.1 hypothetical protein [Bacillota bacterium]
MVEKVGMPVGGFRRWLHWGLGLQLILLGAEFLLGMAVNLWVAVPVHHPGAAAPDYFAGLLRGIPWAFWHLGGLFAAHVLLGLAVWLMAAGLLVGAWRTEEAAVRWATLAGWVGITGAGFNGGSFLNYNHAFSSFLMALGFWLAAGCYVWSWGLTAAIGRPEVSRRG